MRVTACRRFLLSIYERLGVMLNRLPGHARRYWRWVALGVMAAGVLFAGVLLYPMDEDYYLRLHPSKELQDRNGRLLYPYLNENDAWCFIRPLGQISPHLIRATLAVEDQRFYAHTGVDGLAVLRAMKQNVVNGRIVSGASTLTMQVVKFAHPQTRSLWGKSLQAMQALRLDARVGKARILWAYLNNAPYGMNLIGCEAASRRYFGKPASELSLAEAALLAGLPKAPGLYMPMKYPARAMKRRQFVLRRMLDEGVIDEPAYFRARQEALGAVWHEFPAEAPHFAMRVEDTLRPGEQRKTTIDYDMQKETARLAYNAVSSTGGEVKNAAALVVDVSSAAVLAHVGSVDFWDEENDGQVDCTRARRSPGSALKPFTYALAMREQKLYASEVLLDDPWDQGLYNPENFDLEYKGLLPAAEALRLSRNVPAVSVLNRLGVDGMHRFLLELGFTTLYKGPGHFGLGLTLGNCEVKLDELVSAYTMLANLGGKRELRYYTEPKPIKETPCIPRGIGVKLYAMLEQPLPGDLAERNVRFVDTKTRVCWKTGTSQGYRDAWTVVFNRHYVVGVWLGNNDGSPSDRLVGARLALPLAGKIFRSLPTKNTPAWPAARDDLREVRICARSGVPASRWCPHTKMEYIPRAQYLHRVCDMHYPSSKKTGGKRDIVTRWPATARDWDLARIDVPYARENTTKKERAESLRIVSPSDGATFLLTGAKQGDTIQLKTSREHGEAIHWYVNRQYLGLSKPLEPMYLKLTAGRQKITCMSQTGETDSVSIAVQRP
ncbi:penicillin-binding protein 1C [bacterium]|nr:penicillin-binding protein 1C [bacterium]